MQQIPRQYQCNPIYEFKASDTEMCITQAYPNSLACGPDYPASVLPRYS